MYALLRFGYELKEVRWGKQLAELGLCLGAALELVGVGELMCRVSGVVGWIDT